MDVVSRWADDLAHEIKNPLHAMVINLELVKRKAGEPEPVVRRAELVESELHRVHALIESLLRLIRPWPDYPFADVDAVFEHLLPVIRARARIRKVGYEHEPGGGRVAIPPGHLAQILLNLIHHAIEATPADGRFSTRCSTKGDDVYVEVTGVERTIAEEDAEGVLGLGLSERLAKAAGGRLTLRARTGPDDATAILMLRRAGSA